MISWRQISILSLFSIACFCTEAAHHPPTELKLLKLSPSIRSEMIDGGTLMIPLKAISPFLTPTKIIEENALRHTPKIIATEENRVIMAPGDKIFVQGITESTVQSYEVFRRGTPYRDPVSNKVLGYEGLSIGHAQLLRLTEPAVMMITDSKQEILTGDRLLPRDDAFIKTEYRLRQPTEPINSTIVSVFGGVDLVGQYNVIIIRGGKDSPLHVGDRLGIYRKRSAMNAETKGKEISLPDELSGEAMVFRIFDKLSMALVLSANKTLFVGDRVSNLD